MMSIAVRKENVKSVICYPYNFSLASFKLKLIFLVLQIATLPTAGIFERHSRNAKYFNVFRTVHIKLFSPQYMAEKAASFLVFGWAFIWNCFG